MAVAAALRAVRRAADDAAGIRRPRRVAATATAKSSALLEALLEVLPPAQHAHREDIPKGALVFRVGIGGWGLDRVNGSGCARVWTGFKSDC